VRKLEKEMLEAARNLEFERARTCATSCAWRASG